MIRRKRSDQHLVQLIIRKSQVNRAFAQCSLFTDCSPRQLFAVFCCFAYIFIWHGCQWYVFYWSALNFIGILAEAVGTGLRETEMMRRLESFVEPRMWRRLLVLGALPLFASLAIGMFMFFGMHHEVGRVYYQRFVVDDFPSPHFFFALLVMYMQAQSAVTMYKYEETGSVAGFQIKRKLG